MKKRVVITGLGAVTSLGIGVNPLWQSIKSGKCGISAIERIDVSDMPTKIGAEIKDFNPADFIEKKEIKRMDRYTQYAMAAARMAIEDSALDLDQIDLERMGSIIGSGIGGIETLENQLQILLERGPGRISPFLVPMMIANMAAGSVLQPIISHTLIVIKQVSGGKHLK
jgi:3-oxoacyl-[acyl-carrier-protein] synthase II